MPISHRPLAITTSWASRRIFGQQQASGDYLARPWPAVRKTAAHSVTLALMHSYKLNQYQF
jgi:hypothetical protein